MMGRFGRLTPRATTLAVLAMGFVAAYVVPYLLYPPNPPAVGGHHQPQRLLHAAISPVGAVTAVLVGRRLAERLGGWHAALVSIAAYVVVMLVAMALLPHWRGAGRLPASVLYDFRRAFFDPVHAVGSARCRAGRVRRSARSSSAGHGSRTRRRTRGRDGRR